MYEENQVFNRTLQRSKEMEQLPDWRVEEEKHVLRRNWGTPGLPRHCHVNHFVFPDVTGEEGSFSPAGYD